MKKSYIGEKALFLGNGIHRTETNKFRSWGELLEKISSIYGIDTDLKNELKPFPLAFEEMISTKVGSNEFQNKLRNLKTKISKILMEDSKKLIDSEIHRGFMQSGIKEIITTNYDYNLELSIRNDFLQNKKEYSINNIESKHSLYRGYRVNDVNVRHIHGELRHNRNIANENNYPEESIMIGFEHYSDYFSKIQNDILGESGRQKESDKKSVLIRIRDNDTGKVWTDLIFTHHLIFAGFSLDFSENHLWWLLIQREELKRKNKFDVIINNEITFCIPLLVYNSSISYKTDNEEEFNKLYKVKLGIQKNKGVTDILKSLNVKIDQIQCENYKEFYLKVINKYSVN